MKTKNLLFILLAALVVSCNAGCTSVDSGHEGAIISWGGETDMNQTLPEGLHWGFRYMMDDVVEYEVREQTVVVEAKINDRNDMVTPVEVIVYYTPMKGQVNKLHKEFGPQYAQTKLTPILSSSLAKVVPQYNATELNKNKRSEAERVLTETILTESEGMHVVIRRVQLGKVGIPDAVAKLAEETAAQEGRNILAGKKEEEQVQLAKARVAEAQGRYDAGVLDARTRDLLSQPKMLELQRIENEKIMWEGYRTHGKSPYGENNIFGGTVPNLFLNR